MRSTIIAGFPGESRESASLVGKRLKEVGFSHLGVFSYSQEEGTPAAEMPNQVDEEEKEFRRDAILNRQAAVSHDWQKNRVGKTYEVLVEGQDSQTGLYYGRSYAEAPEVDGKIFIKSSTPLVTGNYYPVKVTEAYTYDCVGEVDLPKEGGDTV